MFASKQSCRSSLSSTD